MQIKNLLALPRAWLKTNFPRPAIRAPAWLRRIRISDDAIRTVLLLGGFAAFCWGFWDFSPAAAKVIGGACLIWFAWPSKGRG